jgi:hypothetical protein
LSKVPHLGANQPTKVAPKDELHPKTKKLLENPFTIRRLEAFDIEKIPHNKHKFDVIIRLPNMREAVTKPVPRKFHGPKTNKPFKPKQTGTSSTTPAAGPKDRPRKVSQQSQGERPNSSARPSASNAWSSNTRPSAAHQATTWAKRAAASAH